MAGGATAGAAGAGSAAASTAGPAGNYAKLMQGMGGLAPSLGMALIKAGHPMAQGAPAAPISHPMMPSGAVPLQGLLGMPHPQLPQMGGMPPGGLPSANGQMGMPISVPQMNQALATRNGLIGGF